MKKFFQPAFVDIVEMVKNWRIWLLLGWQDIRLRYRRSYLGPFWITISMAIMIYSMGLLYGGLLHVDLRGYFPFLAGGIVSWTMLSTTIIEMTNAYIESAGYIKQIGLPFSVYIARTLTRNYIIFFHNLIAVIPIFLFFRIKICFFSFLFGLIVVCGCGFIYGVILAMLGSRFRDIKQIIVSIMQIVFLVTPIMWMPNMLPGRFYFAVSFNPFFHMIEIIRSPLMGFFPPFQSILVGLGMWVIGLFLMSWMFFRAKHRIVYWI